MEDEIDANLFAVFKHCKNDCSSFLETIAEFLKKKTDFLSGDFHTVLSEIFTSVANSTEHQNDVASTERTVQHNSAAHRTLGNNGDQNTTSEMTQMNGDNLHDDDDDDEVIPETQMDDSNDSGESVRIPLKVGGEIDLDSVTNDSDNGSEFDPIQPETNDPDSIDPSQQVFDQDLLRGIESSFSKINKHMQSMTDVSASDRIASAPKSVALHSNNTPSKQCVDRSESSTPDLDFLPSANSNDKDISNKPSQRGKQQPNNGDAVQQSNGGGDDDETQMCSENIFDASTQNINPNDLSSDDIFATATEKMPEHPRDMNQSTDDIFGMATQKMLEHSGDLDQTSDDIFGTATQRIPTFLHPAAVSTPRVPNKRNPVAQADDIFMADTQQANTENDIFMASTQPISHDIFEVATQKITIDIPSATEKAVTSKQSNQKPSIEVENLNDTHDSDDLFEEDTEIFDVSEPGRKVQEASIFEMPTQTLDESIIAPTTKQPSKKIAKVVTQCSQLVNTPDWSNAAFLSNEAIDMFSKEQNNREVDDKRSKRLKKNRHLFINTSDEEEEDDDDDDLEFDFGKTTERRLPMPMKTVVTKREHSDDEDDEEMLNIKTKFPNIKVPSKAKTRRLSVQLSREDCLKTLESNKSKKIVEEKKKKIVKEDAFEQRNLRHRKSDPEVTAVESRHSKRTKAIDVAGMQKEKKSKENPKEQIVASKKPRNTEGKAKKPVEIISSVPAIVQNHLDAPFVTRRRSDRSSTRKSERLAILFTQVKPAPYVKAIEKLGGFIVDTPQLGGVLICNKISRTFKFLYALSKGLPIVSSHWIDTSIKHGQFHSPDSFLIVDNKNEERFRFNLRKSLEAARRTPLFANYHIFATPNVQPTPIEISDIVQCAGGKFSNDIQVKRDKNRTAVLITDKKDKKLWNEYRKYHPDILISSSEGFMQSVVQQRIRFEENKL